MKQTKTKEKEKYFEAVGGRKTTTARVRIFENKSGLTINDKPYGEYFRLSRHQQVVLAPFLLAQLSDKVGATVKVRGGGVNSQAEAVRHGLARALIKFNQALRPALKRAGFLTRDSRMVERKKYGLKKARRAPQWQKR